MVRSKVIAIASVVTCCLLQAQGADKYTDENRPYEFGFSINGEQHRHEKKDENGLIMGEFGFITADGVYHVTVYATDEQGRFKILSMKNIRVKPYPTYKSKESGSSSRQGHSLELPVSSQSPPLNTVSSTENSVKKISLEPPGRSCSSCSLPTTSTAAPVIQPSNLNYPNQVAPGFSPTSADISPPAFVNQQTDVSRSPDQPFGKSPVISQQNGFNSPTVSSPTGGSSLSQTALGNGAAYQSQNDINSVQNPPERELVPPQQSYPPQPQNDLVAPQTFFEKVTPQIPENVSPQIYQIGSNSPAVIPQGPINPPQSFGNPIKPDFTQQSQSPASISQESPNGPQLQGIAQPQNVPSGRSPKRLDSNQPFEPAGSQPNSILRGSPNSANLNPEAPTKPTLISAQMQIVDKNTDIHRLNPGEQKGLPKGLTKDDMTHLLYTFNYTVGFHGHFEEGYNNGVKQGYYFVTGRNGVRTRIDYIADSEGFHPKISQEVLDLLSDDVPKPETEREEKYGLKGYEFKWLYYPTETKAR